MGERHVPNFQEGSLQTVTSPMTQITGTARLPAQAWSGFVSGLPVHWGKLRMLTGTDDIHTGKILIISVILDWA